MVLYLAVIINGFFLYYRTPRSPSPGARHHAGRRHSERHHEEQLLADLPRGERLPDSSRCRRDVLRLQL